MDLPIKVVITLFVSFVVGGAVILFAQRTIMTGQQDLGRIGETKEGVEIIKLSATATVTDVEKLARACGQLGVGSVADRDCFVIKGTIPNVASLNDLAIDDATIKVSAPAGATALFITYEPGGIVRIS